MDLQKKLILAGCIGVGALGAWWFFKGIISAIVLIALAVAVGAFIFVYVYKSDK